MGDRQDGIVFQVKTYVAPSAIEGIGVFAGELIPKGAVVWRFDPAIDRTFSPEFIAGQSLPVRDFLARYAYLDERIGTYVLCGDNARFMNHADVPNTVGSYPENERPEGIDVAARDIAVGEELLCDYRAFDAEAPDKLGT